MPDKNEIVAMLEKLICTLELHGNYDVVWTSEKINLIADKLLEGGFVKKTECIWKPLGQRVYGGGRSYTHYCSGCGKNIKGVTREEQQAINNFVELVATLTEILK